MSRQVCVLCKDDKCHLGILVLSVFINGSFKKELIETLYCVPTIITDKADSLGCLE